MISAMDERQRMVKVYGPTLCAAEAEAIANMNRMLFYEKHFYDTALSVDAEDSTPTNAQTQESPLDEDSDVRLPPYARTQLEIMRNAKTLDGKVTRNQLKHNRSAYFNSINTSFTCSQSFMKLLEIWLS